MQRRGELMDEVCAATDGAMAAMIGADENSARALAADADVDVANINSPGQMCVSGQRAKIEVAGHRQRTWHPPGDAVERGGAYHLGLWKVLIKN